MGRSDATRRCLQRNSKQNTEIRKYVIVFLFSKQNCYFVRTDRQTDENERSTKQSTVVGWNAVVVNGAVQLEGNG